MEKKQIKINFHVHSTGSDGKMAPEDVVKEAIAAGIGYMCFTDHYRTPEVFNEDYGFFSNEYAKDVKKLQKEYKDKIDILLGVEFDWLEGYGDWIKKEIEKHNFDYVMGSVHTLFKNSESFEVSSDTGEEGKKKWLETAEKFGGAENFVKEYYRLIMLLIKSGLFDSVGHLDIIKMYNRGQDLFKEDSAWYKKGL